MTDYDFLIICIENTAVHIVARLSESFGGRLELLHLAQQPYPHYYDDGGEEIPYSAIEKWQKVTI